MSIWLGGACLALGSVMSCEKLLRIYDVNPLSLLHKLLSDLLIASEETTVPGEEPQGSMRRFVAYHEIRHRLIIIEVSSTDRTLELNPHDYSIHCAWRTLGL